MPPSDARGSHRAGPGSTPKRATNGISLLSRAFTGLARFVGLALGLQSAGIAPAQNVDYRSSQSAPASWRDYATLTQGELRDRLAADALGAREFRHRLQQARSSENPQPLLVRLWISSEGRIDRVEADGLDDDTLHLLGLVLAEDKLKRPPPDMLQPIHLRLSIREDTKTDEKAQ